ncbi:MAG: YtcA family lipoprotein [Myxococcales bacterium]
MHCPSLDIFGTFFPSWMLCSLLGIACGLSTLTDALNAQKAWSLASASKEQAFAEALISATALAFASGQLGSSRAVPDFRE